VSGASEWSEGERRRVDDCTKDPLDGHREPRGEEERYKQLVEAADAFYLVSEDGSIVDTNTAACDALGWTKEELLGKTIDEIDPSYSVERFREFWRSIPFEERQIFETIHRRKDGTLLSVEISGLKHRLADGTYYYGIARDLAPRKQAEKELRGSNVDLRTRIASDLLSIEADKGQLSQVISNLVINAQQAMPEGGVVTLEAINAGGAEDRYVEITIEDEGIGIAEQYLSRIFDPYFTTKQRGSGLGLAITHSIVDKHGGTITVDSTLNRGTVFRVRLPASKTTAGTAGGSEDLGAAVEVPAKAHILVLEDEEMVSRVLDSMLRRLGHEVSHAATGQEAIAAYRDALESGAPYDVVITDLTIRGGLGGQATARAILEMDPRAKIIVSSGYAIDPVMANHKEHGFRGVVAKPYRLAELSRVVAESYQSPPLSAPSGSTAARGCR